MVQLGQKVKDSLTGFTGVVIAITEWLYGCRRVAVLSEELKDGKPIDEVWFDEQRLTDSPKADAGGPRKDPSRRAEKTRDGRGRVRFDRGRQPS